MDGSGARHLLQTVPSSCATMGVICDQDSIANASILTYTGTGMSYNGVPLVQSPNTNTLLLSADPACTVPGGDKLTFPPAFLGKCRHCMRVSCQLLLLFHFRSGHTPFNAWCIALAPQPHRPRQAG